MVEVRHQSAANKWLPSIHLLPLRGAIFPVIVLGGH
ncbi:hypothetical protein V473_13555 [Sphingobium cupriresistens LL01]|uniref:Uncharacterized protein n=1 Tax=Sphingobium cupriresistens LL01 TaxID=1420583 RepID=A0A0J7XW46_9SPHN|nr:hypothetical protein V473_13555 [Sphingobium cupriresistens LL01]